jgi:hypothetical protein
MFLASQAKKYSRSSLKSMRLVLTMIPAWAEHTGKLVQPNGWLDGIRLPKKVGGRTVTRMELTPEQTLEVVTRMKEPYSTLTLLLASVGVRGEAAIGLQPPDLDGRNCVACQAGDLIRVRCRCKREGIQARCDFAGSKDDTKIITALKATKPTNP